MRRFVGRVVDGWTTGLAAARRRLPVFDHVVRAQERYSEVHAGRLAAAIAYYGFFAAFALAVLLIGILGYVLEGNQAVVREVQQYLERNLPQVRIADLFGTSQSLGKVAVVGLALAGVGWVESLRSSQRAIWGLEQQPGHPVVRWLVDVAVLIGLGVLLIGSVAISSGVQDLLFRLAGGFEQSAVRVALNQSTTLLAGVVDLILAAAVLAGVARLRISLRRLLPSALLIAVGLLALKTLGRWYIARTQHNPAYQVFAAAIGLLVFMYLFHQLVLFGAALAATSQRGTVRDLARRRPRSQSQEPAAGQSQEPAAGQSPEPAPDQPPEPAPDQPPEPAPNQPPDQPTAGDADQADTRVPVTPKSA